MCLEAALALRTVGVPHSRWPPRCFLTKPVVVVGEGIHKWVRLGHKGMVYDPKLATGSWGFIGQVNYIG